MNFSQLSQYLSEIENTSKRLEMTQLIAELFKSLQPEEVASVCYLLQGQLVPNYESKEFQISTKMLLRVLQRLHDPSAISVSKELESRYKQLGDIGLLAEESLGSHQPEHTLSIIQVFSQLESIAESEGKGSQERKVEQTVQLIRDLDSMSARYVTRIIAGKLRLGFSDMTMIDALSWAIYGDKSGSARIELAYQKQADIGKIAEAVLQHGMDAVEKIHVKVGTPVIPALCQRLNTTKEIIDKMGDVYAEPKYDGTRVQIHIKKDSRFKVQGSRAEDVQIKTFTRNLEESSHMFPELQKLPELLDCESCILDAEAIGFEPETGALLPFQQTITRKRKHGVADQAESVPLRFFIFDVMEKDGTELLETPLHERKKILQSLFSDSKHFVHAPFFHYTDPEELHHYHEKLLAEGLEGAVIKKTEGMYQSGRKAYSWVKIKETEGKRGKLSDTVDAIVMGYFYGEGKRTEFGVGALLIGVLDSEQQIATISKVGSGLSEQLSMEFISRAKALIVQERPKNYLVGKQLTPDVWLLPEMVIEVAADEITQSSIHSAGVALRFPRFIRFRDDKKMDQATGLTELSSMIVV